MFAYQYQFEVAVELFIWRWVSLYPYKRFLSSSSILAVLTHISLRATLKLYTICFYRFWSSITCCNDTIHAKFGLAPKFYNVMFRLNCLETCTYYGRALTVFCAKYSVIGLTKTLVIWIKRYNWCFNVHSKEFATTFLHGSENI